MAVCFFFCLSTEQVLVHPTQNNWILSLFLRQRRENNVLNLEGGGPRFLSLITSCACQSISQNDSSQALLSGTFRNPQPLVFSQKHRQYKCEAYCGTNGRRTAVQIGGVLRRFPFSKALKPARHSITNGGGGVLRYKLEVYRQYFSDKLYGLGVPKESPLPICFWN